MSSLSHGGSIVTDIMNIKSVDKLDERSATDGYEREKKEIEKCAYLKYSKNTIQVH